RRKGPLPYAQSEDWKPRRQPLRRQHDRAAGRRPEPGQRLRPRRGSFVLLEEDELQAVQLESARAIDIERHDNRVGRDRADLKNEQTKRPAVAIRNDRFTSIAGVPPATTVGAVSGRKPSFHCEPEIGFTAVWSPFVRAQRTSARREGRSSEHRK